MAIDRAFNRLGLRPNGEWLRLFGEARTRILVWYVGVIVVFIGVAIPTIRHRILSQVERRVQTDLKEEIAEFKELLTDGPIAFPMLERYNCRTIIFDFNVDETILP